jgi:broad specificity phosphatase PhoE
MRLPPPPCPPALGARLARLDPPREPWRGPGRGARVWLVRHGSVDAGDIAYGDMDVQLSDLGRRETERAGRDLAALAPAAVWSSTLSRARALGEEVARRAGCPLVVDARLREVHRGAWQGLAREEYLRRWYAQGVEYWSDPFNWCGHGGESERALRARVVSALGEALVSLGDAPSSPATLVVTAHRQALRALVGALLGLPAAASHGLALDPASAVLCVDEPDGWTLVRTNLPRAGSAQAAEPHDGPPHDVLARPR